jgi:hypothetical protein
VTSEPSCLRTS